MFRKLPVQRVSSGDVTVGTNAAIIGAGDRGSRGQGKGALHTPMASILTKPLLGDHCQTHRTEEETGHTQAPGPATPRSLAWCNTWAGEGEMFAVPYQRNGSRAPPHLAPGPISVPMCPKRPAGLWQHLGWGQGSGPCVPAQASRPPCMSHGDSRGSSRSGPVPSRASFQAGETRSAPSSPLSLTQSGEREAAMTHFHPPSEPPPGGLLPRIPFRPISCPLDCLEPLDLAR